MKAGVHWREANRSVFAEGSHGNGAAMRAAPLGLLYHRNIGELRRATELGSAITDSRPLGIEGAVLIARAVAMALEGDVDFDALRGFCTREEYRGRLVLAKELLAGNPSKTQVRRQLGNGVAHESAVTSVYAFCRFPDDFKAMVTYIVELGGDTDTIGAMAGGVFGAKNGVGALPAELLVRIEQRQQIEALARELHVLAAG
jgi:poly(ADP-ribose) glycohydrolase ARH3